MYIIESKSHTVEIYPGHSKFSMHHISNCAKYYATQIIYESIIECGTMTGNINNTNK